MSFAGFRPVTISSPEVYRPLGIAGVGWKFVTLNRGLAVRPSPQARYDFAGASRLTWETSMNRLGAHGSHTLPPAEQPSAAQQFLISGFMLVEAMRYQVEYRVSILVPAQGRNLSRGCMDIIST